MKFGHFSLAWARENRYTTDCLARIVERLPRLSKSGAAVPKWAKDSAAIQSPLNGAVYR